MTDLSATDRRIAALEQRQDELQGALSRLENRVAHMPTEPAPLRRWSPVNPLLTLVLIAGVTMIALAFAQHMHLGRAVRHLF
jgi:hypothetical protein